MATIKVDKAISEKELDQIVLEATHANKAAEIEFSIDSLHYALLERRNVNVTRKELVESLARLVKKRIIKQSGNCDCGCVYYKYV